MKFVVERQDVSTLKKCLLGIKEFIYLKDLIVDRKGRSGE